MTSQPVFTITYWGITGTLSAPTLPADVTEKLVHALHHLLEQGRLSELRAGPDSLETVRHCVQEHLPFHLRSTYGGNTTCVEVQTPDALIILDCGSGFRELGIDLERRWNHPAYNGSRTAHVLVTHPHMDHTYATPYVDPFFDPRNHFTLYGSESTQRAFEAVMGPNGVLRHTFFPPTYDMMKALRDCKLVEAGSRFNIGSTTITTFALKHPGGCLAYRLENAGRVFVFATDHEHPELPDRTLAEFTRGADLFYTDGQYLAAEYKGESGIMGEKPFSRRGWGHSSVEACVATAVAAEVRELHVGHREPKRNDEDLARVERYLQQRLVDALQAAGRNPDSCRTRIPFEGLTVRI
jgi:phosphoribosyl 1,2-cyclic phosphodiesterase